VMDLIAHVEPWAENQEVMAPFGRYINTLKLWKAIY
jgi:hypothetical protein